MATQTAAERRQEARREYDVYMANCPSRQLLDAVSAKWVTMILIALADGRLRYSDLARTIAGVSQKMLTQTLRSLERDGLVVRTATLAVPVRVDYELTGLGVSLLPLVRSVKDWAELHFDEVEAARGRYDAAALTQRQP